MKPWDEYTAEDDAKLYEDSFDVTTALAFDSEETNNLRVQLQDMEAATLKVREELLQQKSIITELQEKLTKEEEEKQALHSLVDQLRLEVTAENRLRQAAEDQRGMNLVFLKLEMGTQALAAKDREENLQKELAKVKSQLEKEQQTFENVIKESKAAYYTVVREKQHIYKETTYNFAKLSQLQNMDKAEHEKEKWHLLDKMARLRSSHQRQLDRHAKEHVKLQTALEEAQEELQRYCDWEKEKASLIQTSEELKTLQGEQEQHKLLMQDKEKEHQLILQDKEEDHQLILQDKEKDHQLILQDKEEEHRLILQDKEEEHRLMLQDKEEEHQLILQDKEEDQQLILQKITELEKQMQKIIKRTWYQRLFNYSS